METALGGFTSPMLLAGIIGVITAFAIILYRLVVSPYRVFSRHGIKGPRPLPIVGNFLSLRKIGSLQFFEEQLQKYGPVFGFYLGVRPKLVVADVEMAKEILVKEFSKFTNRGAPELLNITGEALKFPSGLVGSHGEEWRTGRHTLTPSFSGMKMKMMEPLLKRSSDVLVEKMGEFAESGKTVEIHREYGMFTMETLVATAFGRYINVQRGEGNSLTDAARAIFENLREDSPHGFDMIETILSTFPCLMGLAHYIIRRTPMAANAIVIHQTALGLIKARVDSKESPKVKDFLQIMIDATAEGGDNATNRLTNEQITGYSTDFLLAGYDTTANTLSYTTYLLATNPDVQEKLQTEIDQFFEEDPESSLYETAQKMKYLEMVIHESMRLYTTGSRVIRCCSETVKIGDVTIPKGVDIIFPVDAIHHKPQFWPDPYKFDPERFTPEEKAKRPQLAHMPFGWGPRSCIGVRFALLETKSALIEILRKYSFARAPETVAKLEQVVGLTSSPKGGVHVKIIPRV